MGSRGMLRGPNKFIKHLFFPHNSQQQTKRCYRDPPHSLMLGGGCQDMLRWSGQNANQKVGPDKMPTTDKSHGQNANLSWHFVRLAFCPVGILSTHHLNGLWSAKNDPILNRRIDLVIPCGSSLLSCFSWSAI